jgi:hypothetical protein
MNANNLTSENGSDDCFAEPCEARSHIRQRKESRCQARGNGNIKNISFYAEDFRLVMLQHPGSLDALIRVCSGNGDDTGREFASAVVQNLAMAPDTNVPMVEHSCLLYTLVNFTEDVNSKTKRNALSAIGSFAIEGENIMIFVTRGDSIILQIMKRLLKR